MKIGIIGSGAIGGLFLAYLSDRHKDIVCTGRPYQIAAFLKEGLFIDGVRGQKQINNIRISTRLKEKVDLAILAVKTQDLDEVVSANKAVLKNSLLMTTQNGVQADYLLAKDFKRSRILTSIVMFGSTFTPPNRIMHNFEGEVVIGSLFKKDFDEKAAAMVKSALDGIFECHIYPDIMGAKYLKIFLNLNNCIPGCIGVSMQEAYTDPDVCKVAIGLIREANLIMQHAKIALQDLPSFKKEKIMGFVTMPFAEAATVFSKVMTNLSKEPLYGSILQSIQRKRGTEINYLNGQIVQLAKTHKQEAPLNERITEMVHSVESTGRFYSKPDFLRETLAIAQVYG